MERASRSYYVERHFEEDVERFICSDRSAMVIVGQSGMGKTTLVAHLLAKYYARGNLCIMFESARLPSDVAEVEAYIVQRLQRTELNLKNFWTQISVACEQRSKRLVVFVDAVNEYNQGLFGGFVPADFIEKLDNLIWSAFKEYPGIKFVITCRPETWRKVIDSARSRFADSRSAYYESNKGLAHELPRFSEEEIKAAYGKYRAASNIQTEFAELSALTRYHLRDPLLLSLATEVYRGGEIPTELDTGEIFVKYATAVGERELIDDLLSEMFAGEAGSREPDVVRRTAIARDTELRERSPRLYEELNMEENSPGYRLKDRNVLRQWTAPDTLGRGDVIQVRFTYDRFAEFLLATELIRKFHRYASVERPEDAAVRLIRANLESAQQMNVVFGSLQQTLLKLQAEPCDYIRILQRIAEVDPRGLGLVISVLARTARTSPTGIEALGRLLKNLEGRRWIGSKVLRFPLIDAVYRVLRNEEYRLWLDERPEGEQSRHLRLFYGYFHWGFRHRDSAVSGSAIQYLSFLWRGQGQSLSDAVGITGGLVGLVAPLSLIAYVFYTGKRRLLQNLGGLMMLIIGESEEEARSAEALRAARDLLVRLRVHKSTALRLIWPLTKTLSRQLQSVLASLRNPVNLAMVERFFADSATNLKSLEKVRGIFSFTRCDVELKALARELAQSDNGFLLEMLTLALSAFYERQAALGSGPECLSLLEELFLEGATPRAQYCASLALYHINYFGQHANRESMELMERMAKAILHEHKGVFSLGDKKESFNIIGTYGRALYKNGHLLEDGAARGPNRRALQYAIDALKQARADGDFQYYLYICKDVGLLGVLIEPTQVFAVFSEILRDIQEIPHEGHNHEELFSLPERCQIRDRVLKSLANIRALYRQAVDKYLLDELELPDLYAEVANRLTAEFNLATFYSWAFEELMFRVLTRYYEQVGKEVLDTFIESVHSGSLESGLGVIVNRVMKRLSEISA